MPNGMNWDRVHKQRPAAAPPKGERGHEEPRIAQSYLSVSLGQRLAERCGPMPNIKGDRPPDPFGDD